MPFQSRWRDVVGSILFLLLALVSKAHAQGKFEGRFIVEPLDDGRNLRTVEAFSYVDGQKRKWEVPKGYTTNGASVPRLLWSWLPPFSGKYRKAAVIHDHYCESRIRPWQTVHNMFHEAMLAAGVDKVKADAMFAAVYAFGPRWKFRKGHWTSRNIVRRRQRRSSYQSQSYERPKQRRWIPTRATLPEVAKIPEAEQQAAAKELARWIEENQPTKSQIITMIQKAQVREKGARNLKK